MTTRAARRRMYRRRRRAAGALLVVLLASGVGSMVAVRHGVLGRTQNASAPSGGAAAGSGSGSSKTPPTASPAASAPVEAAPTHSSPGFDATAHSTTDPASPWVVVNKAHPIVPRTYAPASVTTVGGKQVSSVIVPDLDAMLTAAAAAGVHLTLASGYRSYTYQVGVHDRLVAQQGLTAAERVSARPGFSEHQTGLAIDFGSSTDPACTLKNCYASTVEGRWLDAHATQYGFLHRYTAANTAITGYSPEAWHYRWVGRDLTAAMAARDLTTLEQFFGVSGGALYAPPAP